MRGVFFPERFDISQAEGTVGVAGIQGGKNNVFHESDNTAIAKVLRGPDSGKGEKKARLFIIVKKNTKRCGSGSIFCLNNGKLRGEYQE